MQFDEPVERRAVVVDLLDQPLAGDQQRRLVARIAERDAVERVAQAFARIAEQRTRVRRAAGAVAQCVGGGLPRGRETRLQRRDRARAGAVRRQRRHAARECAEQRCHPVPHGGRALREILRLGLAEREQIVDAVDAGEQRVPLVVGRCRREAVALRGDDPRDVGGDARHQRVELRVHVARAEQHRHEAQAQHADRDRRAAPDHMLEGQLGMLHRAVGREADRVAGHHGARRAEVPQQRHARDADAEPEREAEDEQQRLLREAAHQHERDDHPRDRADHTPHALADHRALDGIDHEQHRRRGRIRGFQFEQVRDAERERGGDDRACDIRAARREDVDARDQRRGRASQAAGRRRDGARLICCFMHCTRSMRKDEASLRSRHACRTVTSLHSTSACDASVMRAPHAVPAGRCTARARHAATTGARGRSGSADATPA
ncbi:hypothetical protein CSX04_08166 [Burkholderia cepacia]|nr:hypothetical protein CSX04_08166 [Burkholderia cepacia]